MIFWQFFQMSKFCQKSTFAPMESLFDAGFPLNLRPVCILRWSNVSWRNFQFFAKFIKCRNFAKNRPLHLWNPYLMMDFHQTSTQCQKNVKCQQNIKFSSSWPPGTSSGNQGSSVLPLLDQMRAGYVMSSHLIPCFIACRWIESA